MSDRHPPKALVQGCIKCTSKSPASMQTWQFAHTTASHPEQLSCMPHNSYLVYNCTTQAAEYTLHATLKSPWCLAPGAGALQALQSMAVDNPELYRELMSMERGPDGKLSQSTLARISTLLASAQGTAPSAGSGARPGGTHVASSILASMGYVAGAHAAGGHPGTRPGSSGGHSGSRPGSASVSASLAGLPQLSVESSTDSLQAALSR